MLGESNGSIVGMENQDQWRPLMKWFLKVCNELDRAILVCHVCLDGRGGLIVRDVEHGFVPLVRQL